MAAASASQKRPGVRVLVLSADVGESHAEMARVLQDQLLQRSDVSSVTILNDLFVLGSRLGGVLSRGFRFHLAEVKWSYDLAYTLFTRVFLARAVGERALARLGGNALLATVRRHRPDVVVSTYPVMNPVLASLRTAGLLPCPAASVVGLGGLRFWVQPGLDLHLAQYGEAVPAIRRLASGAPVEPVRPLVRSEFFEARSRDAARSELRLAPDRPAVLMSGGGWGAGDLARAIDACLDLPGICIIAVAGRNAALERSLRSRYDTDAAVTVLGFTNRMRDLLSAADAFITATAGMSCIEARLCDCPIVAYEFSIGHVRDNSRALTQQGLARRADGPAALTASVRDVLASGRTSMPCLHDLPSAAELTVRLARRDLEASDRAASTDSPVAPVPFAP